MVFTILIGSLASVCDFSCFSKRTSIVSSIISFWPSPDCLYTSVPFGSIIAIVGQPVTPNLFQTVIFLSTRTGCDISYLATACSIFFLSCSLRNFAECTPMNTTGTSLYFSSSSASTGNVCMQLMQQYVQKSKTMIWPLSFSSESGSFVFIQSNSVGNSGALMTLENILSNIILI